MTPSWRKTPPMVVASNTSPISNLAIIGRLDLLRIQFHEIWIPGAVQSELDRLHHREALTEIQQAVHDGWIRPRALRADKVARLLEAALDPGQAEAIALALELPANLTHFLHQQIVSYCCAGSCEFGTGVVTRFRRLTTPPLGEGVG